MMRRAQALLHESRDSLTASQASDMEAMLSALLSPGCMAPLGKACLHGYWASSHKAAAL